MTKKDIRPNIPSIKKESINADEQFQNEILRPILKLQHDLILAFFQRHLESKKIKINTLSLIKKEAVSETVFKTDQGFKSVLKGMVVGMFTIEEYSSYIKMESQINKRILALTKQRITSTF